MRAIVSVRMGTPILPPTPVSVFLLEHMGGASYDPCRRRRKLKRAHIHVVPIWSPTDLDFGNADHRAKDADLDAAAETIRSELRKLGHAEVSE